MLHTAFWEGVFGPLMVIKENKWNCTGTLMHLILEWECLIGVLQVTEIKHSFVLHSFEKIFFLFQKLSNSKIM